MSAHRLTVTVLLSQYVLWLISVCANIRLQLLMLNSWKWFGFAPLR